MRRQPILLTWDEVVSNPARKPEIYSTMEPAIKSLSRSWVFYLAAVGLSAGILIAAGEKSVSPKPWKAVDLSASRAGSISELSKSSEWRNQAKFFNKNFLGPDTSDWRNPPASQAVSADIAQLQQRPKNDLLYTISISGPDEEISPDDYHLQIRSRTYSSDVNAPVDIKAGPLLHGNGPISFQLLKRPGFFGGGGPVTRTVMVTSDTLDHNQPTSLDLPVVDEMSKEVGQSHLHLRLRQMGLDPDQISSETQHEATGSAAEIDPNAITGDLSFNDVAVARDWLIAPAGRYTTLIITGDQDLREHVRCIDTATGKQVGVYSDRFPMMAVAVKDWASIKVHVSVHSFGEKLHYRIISLSAEQDATKAMLLWFVMHDLSTKQAEGRVLSLPEIDARALWLKDGLAVQFSDEEIRDVQDPDTKRVLDHFRNLH